MPLSSTNRNGGWLIAAQPRLGTAGLVALLVVANAIVSFSLDIYTPAVPEMPAAFNTTELMVNLTIIGFFLFFAVGLLVFGPLSDKFGRKPVFVGGMVLYAAASAPCALSFDILMLIGARVLQALGAGAINSVSTALVEDCFAAERRGVLLALIQIMAVVGPVCAPLLGGFIIAVSSWRAVFWVLAAIGAACLVAALLFAESLPEEQRVSVGVVRSLSGLVHVARHRKFMLLLSAAALFSLPFMVYVAVGSYVYVDFFGQTPQAYTYFFAGTAAFSVLGSVLYTAFAKRISPYRFTYGLIGACFVVGVALLLVGDRSVWVFVSLMALFAISEAAVRPYTTDMLLGLRDGDAGSASSMINFLNTVFGVVGMGLIMLPFPGYVAGLGVLVAAAMVCAFVLWALTCRCPNDR